MYIDDIEINDKILGKGMNGIIYLCNDDKNN